MKYRDMLRVVMDEKGDCWWIASDVCKVLELDLKCSMKSLCKSEKNLVSMKKYRLKKYVISKTGLKKLVSKSAKKNILDKTDLWSLVRSQSKSVRKEETEVIQQFIDYAIDQGADECLAEKYYGYITKATNEALFGETKTSHNFRNSLNVDQLRSIILADYTVIKALQEGMEKEMFHEDIYENMKNRLEEL